MLVNVGLHIASLADSGGSAIDLRATHLRFLKLWREVGVLVHAGAGGQVDRQLLAAVEALPVNLRKLWEEHLKVERKREVGPPFVVFQSVEQRTALAEWVGTIALACVSETRARSLGLSEEAVSVQEAGIPEVCRLRHADLAVVVQRACELARQPLGLGMSTDEVWDTRFAPILSCCDGEIAVVDRYAVARVIKGGSNPAGLLSFIGRVAAAQPRLKVAVFASPADCGTSDDVLQAAEKAIRGMRLRRHGELTLFVSDTDRDFGRLAHFRAIRFGRTVCEIDSGLEVMEGTQIRRLAQFSVKPCTRSTFDTERALRSVSQRRLISARS